MYIDGQLGLIIVYTYEIYAVILTKVTPNRSKIVCSSDENC